MQIRFPKKKERKSILKIYNLHFLYSPGHRQNNILKRKNNGAKIEFLPNDVIEINFNPINN